MSIWDELDLPVEETLSLKLVKTDGPFMWSWAKNSEGHIGFAIELSSSDHDVSSFDQTKELSVSIKNYSSGKMLTVLCVAKNEHRPLEPLFLNLINGSSSIDNEYELINQLKTRFNAWCLLFKLGYKKLKDNEILGLAAELKFLEEWLETLGENVSGWVGPLKKHQDFISEKNSYAFEVKLGRWDPESISISSMEQLDFEGNLCLVVYPGKKSEKDEAGSTSLPHMVQKLKNKLDVKDFFTLTNRLIVAGYDETECEELYFEIGLPIVFQVTKDFPKLTRKNVPDGISKCNYNLILSDLDNYKTVIKN